jgi:hypothetical protein
MDTTTDKAQPLLNNIESDTSCLETYIEMIHTGFEPISLQLLKNPSSVCCKGRVLLTVFTSAEPVFVNI